MICLNCGTYNDDKAERCCGCGRNLREVLMQAGVSLESVYPSDCEHSNTISLEDGLMPQDDGATNVEGTPQVTRPQDVRPYPDAHASATPQGTGARDYVWDGARGVYVEVAADAPTEALPKPAETAVRQVSNGRTGNQGESSEGSANRGRNTLPDTQMPLIPITSPSESRSPVGEGGQAGADPLSVTQRRQAMPPVSTQSPQDTKTRERGRRAQHKRPSRNRSVAAAFAVGILSASAVLGLAFAVADPFGIRGVEAKEQTSEPVPEVRANEVAEPEHRETYDPGSTDLSSAPEQKAPDAPEVVDTAVEDLSKYEKESPKDAAERLIESLNPKNKGKSAQDSNSKDTSSESKGSDQKGSKSEDEDQETSSESDESGNADKKDKGTASEGSRKSDEPKTPTSSSRVGDPYAVSRLVNGGHMVVDNRKLYFAQPLDDTNWDTKSIVTCNLDGSKKKVLYRGPDSTVNLYRLNISKGYLVLTQVLDDGSSSIVCVRTSDGRARTLDDCDDWSYCQVEGETVYYQKNQTLQTCNLADNTYKSLADLDSGSWWRVVGDSLITYSEDGKSAVCTSKLDGSKREVIYRVPSGFVVKKAFPVGDNILIIWTESTDGDTTELTWVGLKDKASKRFWSRDGTIERLCAFDKGVLVTLVDPDGLFRIIRIGYDGNSATSVIADDPDEEIRYTCYTGGRIFYGVVTDDLECSVRSAKVSGANPTVISD